MYAANQKIKDYLVGRGFSVLSSDYRYFYFEDTPSLQTAISEIPVWGNIWFASDWGWS